MDVAVQAYVDGTYTDVPPSVLEDVASGSVSLLALVKALGPALTAEGDTTRTRAVALLSGVVVHLTSQNEAHTHAQLQQQTVHVLTNFFCDKLADAAAVADAAARRSNTAAPVPATAPRAAQRDAEDRALANSAMLVECLRALHALSGVGFVGQELAADAGANFGGDEARAVCRALFASVEVRNEPLPLRYLVYTLLDSLVARNRAGLRALRKPVEGDERALEGSGFVQGYTKMVTGEKDPRNLLLLFGIARVLLLEWKMDRQDTEAFYDVLLCYFPITFRSPPDDPYGITPEALKEALRAAVCATPAFAPLTMPLLLDKLGTSGGGAKLDTLDTLSACLPVYGHGAAQAHAADLWALLKLEILQPSDDETAAHAQTTLTALLRVLYEDAPDAAPPGGLVREVLDECLGELREPGKSLARMSVKVVQSLVAATPATSTLAIREVVAQLLAQPDAGASAPVLELLAAVLEVLYRAYAPPADTEQAGAARSYEGDGRPLDPFRERLLATLRRGLEHRIETPALHALIVCVQIRGLLTSEELHDAATCMDAVLLAPAADEALCEHALGGLERLLRAHKRTIEQVTLPFLLEQLPYTLPVGAEHAAERDAMLGRVRRTLGALARLCTDPDLFDMLLVRLLAFLDAACGVRVAGGERAVHAGYVCALLAALQVALERKARERHTDLGKYAMTTVERLVTMVADGGHGDPEGAPAAAAGADGVGSVDRPARVSSEVVVLRQTGNALSLLAAHLPRARHGELADQVCLRLGVHGAAHGAAHDAAPSGPLRATSPQPVLNLLAPLAAALAPLLAADHMPCGAALLPTLLDWLLDRTPSTGESEALQSQSAYLLLFTALNKYTEAAKLAPGGAAAAPLEAFWHRIVQGGMPHQRRVQAVQAWVWAARAQLARGDARGTAMLDALRSQLFGDAQLATAAAHALRILVGPDGVLTRQNGFQVRLLYKQRVLSELLPRLVEQFRASAGVDARVRDTCLIALAALLPSMPEPTLCEQVRELVPLLVHMLGVDDAAARASAAHALLVAMTAAVNARGVTDDGAPAPRTEADTQLSALLAEHLAQLVQRLVDNVVPGPSQPLRTRIAALRALGALVTLLEHDQLLPQRRAVVQALGRAGQGIDDPRREVRLHAVDTRDLWYRVNAAAE